MPFCSLFLFLSAGDELTAHTTEDSVSLVEVVKATEFYALLPAMLKTTRLPLRMLADAYCAFTSAGDAH